MRLLAILVVLCQLPCSATTIAYDGKMVASDSQVTSGNKKFVFHRKLWVIRGDIIGAAGNCDAIDQFQSWYRDRGTPPKFDGDFHALVVNRKGECFIWDQDLSPKRVEPPYAIGSGGKYALKMMNKGMTAESGVLFATLTDLYSGGAVQVIRVGEDVLKSSTIKFDVNP